MSKRSRELARRDKPKPALPKGIAVVGIIAVMAVAVVASRTITRGTPGTAATDAAAVAPSAGSASGTADIAATSATNAAAPSRKLLFFMNPYGYPCQTQDGILHGVADSLSKVAQLVYYRTTESADMQKFEAYGIRGLPTLVIADRDGRELSRFSPGIQSGEAVLAALTK